MADRQNGLEMGSLTEEDQGLLDPEPGVRPPVTEAESAAKAAYKEEMTRKRTWLLVTLLVPVVLIVLMWHFLGSSEDVGPAKGSQGGHMTVSEYRNQIHSGYEDLAPSGQPMP